MNSSEKLNNFINESVDGVDKFLEKLKKNNQSIKNMKCKGCALCSVFLQDMILHEFKRIVLSKGLAVEAISPLIHQTISDIENETNNGEIDRKIEKLEEMFKKSK